MPIFPLTYMIPKNEHPHIHTDHQIKWTIEKSSHPEIKKLRDALQGRRVSIFLPFNSKCNMKFIENVETYLLQH